MARATKAETFTFTYKGDGKGNLRFFYGAKPMWKGQVFAVDRSIAHGFVTEMNMLNGQELNVAGGPTADFFYQQYLEPNIPRTRWQRFVRWFKKTFRQKEKK